MTQRTIVVGTVLLVTGFMSGCATVGGGTNQLVAVETTHQGEKVVGASCTLQNDKGRWYVNSPGAVTVHRAYGDLVATCEDKQHNPGTNTFTSSTKGLAFGNILLGGIVGAAVDVGSGAAYDYPSILSVELGDHKTPPDERAAAEPTAAISRKP